MRANGPWPSSGGATKQCDEIAASHRLSLVVEIILPDCQAGLYAGLIWAANVAFGSFASVLACPRHVRLGCAMPREHPILGDCCPHVGVSPPDMTSSQPTVWRSSNSHQSEFGCVLMSPRPGSVHLSPVGRGDLPTSRHKAPPDDKLRKSGEGELP